MALSIIPIRNDIPAYTEQLDLEGTRYFMRFKFNSRVDRWFMDLLDENQSEILNGIKIIVDFDLLGRFKDERLPPGLLYAVDESGNENQPDRLNFSNDVTLLYLDSDDFEDIANG